MKAMILAAGLGTRLAPFTNNHPKALAKVDDITLLEWNLHYLQKHGIYEVIVNVHHFAEQIEKSLHDHKGWGSDVCISDERNAVLETGGGLKKAAGFFAGEDYFVVMNVDVLTDLDLGQMILEHTRSTPTATLAVMERVTSRYLLFDRAMHVCGWKNEKTGLLKGEPGKPLAFTGVQIISAGFLGTMPQTGKFSLIDAYLDAALKGQKILGYNHTGDRFLDVGKPDTLASASGLFLQ